MGKNERLRGVEAYRRDGATVRYVLRSRNSTTTCIENICKTNVFITRTCFTEAITHTDDDNNNNTVFINEEKKVGERQRTQGGVT